MSGLAIASLTLSILSLLFACLLFGLPSLAAIVCGHIALAKAKDGRRSGVGFAAAGLAIGYVGLVPAVLLSVWFFFEPGAS